MKRTTRNNILRYVISAAFVSIVLIATLLICIGLDWLTDKTGWPILPSFCITCFVYAVWRVGKGITVSDEEKQIVKLEPSKDLEKQVVKLEPSKDLEKEFDKCCENYIFDDECEVYTARKFFKLGFKAKGEEVMGKIKGYVARDKDGSLWFHYTKPHRENDIEKTWWGSNDKTFKIYDFDFPEYADLTWEESEPVEVELILRRVKEEEVNRTHRVSQPEKLGTDDNKK